ncbi:MAG: flagellar basal-body rod modification protein FlgD [Gammaproteobacteria bacterium]|jgi:flagellar basal-body rod modification protein FlgD
MTTTPDIKQPTFSDLGLTKTATVKTPTKELGQPEFFDLMLAQLKFQDPTKPLDNTDFVGQMAQFSTVNSLSSMDGSLGELVGAFQSSQALQASTLVGRDVLVPSNTAVLRESESVLGTVDVHQATDSVRITVTDQRGEIVKTMDLGTQASGAVQFGWDGLNSDGEPANAGEYTLTATLRTGDQTVAAQTLVRARVDSVTVRQTPPGTTLNLAGIGAVDMSVVKEFL